MFNNEEIQGIIQLLRSKDVRDVEIAFEMMYNRMDKELLPDLHTKRLHKKLLKEIVKKTAIKSNDRRLVSNNSTGRQVYDNLAWKINKFTKDNYGNINKTDSKADKTIVQM